MMWPVGQFYGGSHNLAKKELRLADMFRERGHEDFATCLVQGRGIQRIFSIPGPDTSFYNYKTFTNLFRGFMRAFSFGDDWEQWNCNPLKTLESDKSF